MVYYSKHYEQNECKGITKAITTDGVAVVIKYEYLGLRRSHNLVVERIKIATGKLTLSQLDTMRTYVEDDIELQFMDEGTVSRVEILEFQYDLDTRIKMREGR